MGTLKYARAVASTTLLNNALADLWTKASRSHESCVKVSAYLLYTHAKIRDFLDEVGCELTAAEINEVYKEIEASHQRITERTDPDDWTRGV